MKSLLSVSHLRASRLSLQDWHEAAFLASRLESKLSYHVILIIAFTNLFALGGHSITPKTPNVTAQSASSVEQISKVIVREFGTKVEVESSATPFYLLGDFNGDGLSDIAVLVRIEDGRKELKDHQVRFVDIDPYSRNNGTVRDPVLAMGNHCLGIAVIHGAGGGWTAPTPMAKYIFYECFSEFRLIRKDQKIRRGSGSRGMPPVRRGDSIQLELENGGTALVYWTGKTYRGFAQRLGD